PSASRVDATKPPLTSATGRSSSATTDTARTPPPSSSTTRVSVWAPPASSTPSPTDSCAERNCHDDPILLRTDPKPLRPARAGTLAPAARDSRHPQGPLSTRGTVPRARAPRHRQDRHQAVPATPP